MPAAADDGKVSFDAGIPATTKAKIDRKKTPFIRGKAEDGEEGEEEQAGGSGPGCCKCEGGPRQVACTVLTCGLYPLCRRTLLAPCLEKKEKPQEEPEVESLKGGLADDSTFNDLYIAGVKVPSPNECLDDVGSYSPYGVIRTQPGYRVTETIPMADFEEEEDVDSLITKKLLELYTEYQIQELARCTSDSVFLRKTQKIDSLINSLAEEHRMNEQEAECRLVRGIIRISTRKSGKRRPAPSRHERTLSDSGNETMNGSSCFSFSNNNDYKSNPNIQISEQTSSDKFAREMWKKNGDHSSGSPTDTDSSGVPLLSSFVRT